MPHCTRCGIPLFGSCERDRPLGFGTQGGGVSRCIRSRRPFGGRCSSRRGAVRGGVRRRTHAPVRYGTSAGQSFRPALHGILHPADPRDSRVESVGRLRLFRECAQVEQLDDLRQERRTAARGGGGVARCEEAPRVRLYSARGGPEHDIPPFTARTLPVCVVLPAAGGYVGLP